MDGNAQHGNAGARGGRGIGRSRNMLVDGETTTGNNELRDSKGPREAMVGDAFECPDWKDHGSTTRLREEASEVLKRPCRTLSGGNEAT
jgi:hypothetical protein